VTTKPGCHITILVDNKAENGLATEHGFAAWIEADGRNILFDTGQSTALEYNCLQLGFDCAAADSLILSHGHYDHTGGVPGVLKRNSAVQVYFHPAAMADRYSLRPDSPPKNIAMPHAARDSLKQLPAGRVTLVEKPCRLSPSIGITGTIPRHHPAEHPDSLLYLDPDGRTPDPVVDDMALWIISAHGLVIITGCCHAGLINTINYIRRVSGIDIVYAVIGGFHLKNASRKRIACTCRALQEWNPVKVIPCHCTGEEAITQMQNETDIHIIPGYAGYRM